VYLLLIIRLIVKLALPREMDFGFSGKSSFGLQEIQVKLLIQLNLDGVVKSREFAFVVIPAKAGIQ